MPLINSVLMNVQEKLSKYLSFDLRSLTSWLKANGISDLKLELNGKRLYPTGSVKYLGV